MDKLADYGWYVNGSMPIMKVFESAKNGILKNTALIDKEMIKHYKAEKKDIKRKLIKEFPDRSSLFLEAFKCHDKKFFSASTSLFISQADGILAGKLFVISKEKKSLKDFLNASPQSEYIYDMLTKIRGLDCYTADISKYSSNLNRHNIMHGFSTDYGTEINSLKALSLLSFIADFQTRTKRPATNSK